MKKRQKNKNPYQNKTSYEFIRWGTLGLQIHKEASLPGNSEDRDFHIAPTKKGIYAFPKGYVETFLLGVSPENIIEEKGSWIKTTMKVWLDALKKLNTIDR